MENLKSDFLSYISSERALSENTRLAYGRDLDELILFCTQKKLGILNLSLTQVREFMASLRRRGNQERSLARKSSTLKQFFQFLLRENVVHSDPTELLSIQVRTKRLPKTLTELEMERLVESAGGAGEQDTRDRALLELWYATGARVSELAMLPGSAFDWRAGTIQVRGKGGTDRLIPVSQEARRWCLKYRDVRLEWVRRMELKDPKPFFLNLRGRAFSRQSIALLLQRYAKRAGISRRVWPHLIRHTFATHVLGGGADLRVVQELLGHQSVTTTEIYTHLDIENLKVMQIKYHPRR